MTHNIRELFGSVYGYAPQITAFAPGRVNLVGEHTDYNGGYVFPCAVNMGIEGSAAVRSDRKIRLFSENFREIGVVESSLDALTRSKLWTDYVLGVIKSFGQFVKMPDRGLDIAFMGDLPDGAGLSSSAAIEVLTAFLLKELFHEEVITKQELALIGQRSENDFIGVSCGIMDQFASAMGKDGQAILLNSGDLGFEYAPLPCDKAAVVVINSGVKHSLASSAYNARHRECAAALEALQTRLDVSSLCEVTENELQRYSEVITDESVRRRAYHAVSENARTIQAAKALKKGDIERFGKLMNKSHFSLRYDFEVSCAELDFLADTAQKLPGVYGARMTGGGFGGCTVNLVKPENVDSFIDAIRSLYKERFGIHAEAYVVRPSDGVHRI